VPVNSNPELKFLRWAEKENIDNVFIPWEKVNHPLFPELEVEVGGIYPFAMINPPYNMIGPILLKYIMIFYSNWPG
jgi:hypothetical protein